MYNSSTVMVFGTGSSDSVSISPSLTGFDWSFVLWGLSLCSKKSEPRSMNILRRFDPSFSDGVSLLWDKINMKIHDTAQRRHTVRRCEFHQGQDRIGLVSCYPNHPCRVVPTKA